MDSVVCSLLQERIFLTLSNYIFTAVFLAEMTVKVKGVAGGWQVGVGWGSPKASTEVVTRASPGGGAGLVLWGAGVPAQQLECAGRATGAHLRHRHPGVHRLRQRHQDPGHAAGAATAADPAPAQVGPLPSPFLTIHPDSTTGQVPASLLLQIRAPHDWSASSLGQAVGQGWGVCMGRGVLLCQESCLQGGNQ